MSEENGDGDDHLTDRLDEATGEPPSEYQEATVGVTVMPSVGEQLEAAGKGDSFVKTRLAKAQHENGLAADIYFADEDGLLVELPDGIRATVTFEQVLGAVGNAVLDSEFGPEREEVDGT